MPIHNTNNKENKYPVLFDMHSHILPHMDDGCKNIDETYENLIKCKEQGVRYICATPHYGNDLSLEEFLEKRNTSYLYTHKQLSKHLDNLYIIPGAEVAYYDGITTEENLSSLCYGKSQYMLIEMPFGKWNSHVINDINILNNSYGYNIVIAHIERYLDMQSKKIIADLFDTGVLIQVNAGYILDRKTEKKALKLIESGHVDIIGSDCHSPKTRPENVGFAFDKLYEKGMDKAIEKILNTELNICKAAAE